MKLSIIIVSLCLTAGAFAQSNLGGNYPGTETYPSAGNPDRTPSGVDKDKFEGKSMEIDSETGKQRMEDVKNTGDDSLKQSKGKKDRKY